MKCTELRIGNLFYALQPGGDVLIPAEIPLKVVGVFIFEIQFVGKDVSPSQVPVFKRLSLRMVSPIPFTNVWAQTFGFIEDNEYEKFLISLKTGKFYVLKYTHCRWYLLDEEYSFVIASFEYVHEFQNLWFALQGEEIDYK